MIGADLPELGDVETWSSRGVGDFFFFSFSFLPSLIIAVLPYPE